MNLAEALRLIVITDHGLAKTRSVDEVVLDVLRAGVKAIQLRDKEASARDLLDQALRLRERTREFGALLFINDRLDVALAAGTDGVHLGPDDLPVGAARSASPPDFLIGTSTDVPDVALDLQFAGADYIGCGAVFPTTSKKDAGEVIGVEGLAAVASAVDIPVVGIGGVTPEGARLIAEGSGAVGTAAISAVMAAPDPGKAALELLGSFKSKPAQGDG